MMRLADKSDQGGEPFRLGAGDHVGASLLDPCAHASDRFASYWRRKC
jgi:hypothetical protein